MIVLQTPRMSIRPLSYDDVPELALTLADHEVMRYPIRGVMTQEETRALAGWYLRLYRDYGYGPWALVDKGSSALAGFCGLSPETIGGKEEVHVGYRLARRFWWQGLATEAVRAVLAYAAEHIDISSVAATIEPDHVASIRVIEKADFERFECKRYRDREVRVYHR